MVKVVKETAPLLTKLNYMLYSAAVGAVAMYIYVSGYGGTMPPAGSFYTFIVGTWNWLMGPIILPIIIAVVQHYVGKKKMKRRSSD